MDEENRCLVSDLGRVRYEEAWELQKQLVELRLRNIIPDTLLLLEHFPVITCGRQKNWKNILVSQEDLQKEGIQFFLTERGGDVTYHGPGQLVGYPIVRLANRYPKLRDYLNVLEQLIIEVLADYQLKGERRTGHPGIWTKQGKIAFLGIAVRDFKVAYHGFAFNINPRMKDFKLINPCGMRDLKVTSLSQIVKKKIEIEKVKVKIKHYFSQLFGAKIQGIDLPALRHLVDRSFPNGHYEN